MKSKFLKNKSRKNRLNVAENSGFFLQATSDLETIDKQRKEEFKRYEMEKEHERRQKLSKMTPEERVKEEAHEEELKKKHKDHPKIHEPVSRVFFENRILLRQISPEQKRGR